MEKEQGIKLTGKKVAFHTLGCRLNMAESGSIAQGFMDRGYQIVDFGVEADVVFLNTCTVTDGADSTCRNLIRKARHSSPEGKVVVAGCYAQMESEKISQMQGVDLILGTSEKYKVFDYLLEDEEQIIKVDKSNEFWGASTTPADSHTRAFLKIQDGCNYVCSFCIIPFARGRSRTIKSSEAIHEARKLVHQGYKEIVLTGVNIGEYENRSGEKLSYLIQELLKLEGLERLRLSSVEPNTITDELLEVMKGSPKFMDHFHIPLQSGDDSILKSMRRKYTVSQYKNIIDKVKKAFPLAGIGADVIVGHPGEGEQEFQNTFSLLRDLPITHFHVFPFSKRKGTTAASLAGQVPHGVKKNRVNILNSLGKAKLKAFAEEMQGKTFQVLFEQENATKYFEGYTSNFLRVRAKALNDKKSLHQQMANVVLRDIGEKGIEGEILSLLPVSKL